MWGDAKPHHGDTLPSPPLRVREGYEKSFVSAEKGLESEVGGEGEGPLPSRGTEGRG